MCSDCFVRHFSTFVQLVPTATFPRMASSRVGVLQTDRSYLVQHTFALQSSFSMYLVIHFLNNTLAKRYQLEWQVSTWINIKEFAFISVFYWFVFLYCSIVLRILICSFTTLSFSLSSSLPQFGVYSSTRLRSYPYLGCVRKLLADKAGTFFKVIAGIFSLSLRLVPLPQCAQWTTWDLFVHFEGKSPSLYFK